MLLDAGFEQAQAEALAVTVREAVTDHVATKDDLNIVKSDLEKEIGALRVEIAQQSRNLYKQLWVMGFGIVVLNVSLTVGIIAALIMPL